MSGEVFSVISSLSCMCTVCRERTVMACHFGELILATNGENATAGAAISSEYINCVEAHCNASLLSVCGQSDPEGRTPVRFPLGPHPPAVAPDDPLHGGQ